MGIKRGVAAEQERQFSSKVDKVGGRIDPILEIRNGDYSGGVDKGVGAFNEHIRGGIEVDGWGLAGVGVEEPDDEWNVVRDVVEGDGDGAIGLK